MILQIELVPRSCWFSNVRSCVPKETWDTIRKDCYRRAAYRCEICDENGHIQGYNHKVECHEIWTYDELTRIQKLERFICLCPLCHEVKHAGLTITKKGIEPILERLMKINKWTHKQASYHTRRSFDLWAKHSKWHWHLDISYLNTYIEIHKLKILS